MTGKLAVLPVVAEHLATLTDARTGASRLRAMDLVTQFGMPVAVAVAAPFLGARLQDAGQIIAGAAVLAGLSFGLAVYVFQLRMEATRKPVRDRPQVIQLIDELFSNVRYSVLAGLLTVGVATVGTAFHSPEHPLNGWWTGAIIGVGLHYVTVVLMCLKRLGSAYRKLAI